ncbi:MAG: FAD binding domain-containing protein [Hyphomicrobiaceae bacterium]
MPIRVETVQRIDDAARIVTSSRLARVFGGGTLLMRDVNEADPSIETLIIINDPALKEIRSEGDRIVVGAGVTMAQILASRELAFLAAAARVIGGPAVRSAATIGGNLFAPPPYGEVATALLALGATVQLAGAGAPMPIEDFLRERGPGRVVRSISVPRLADPNGLRFRKVTRVKPKGAPVMSIAILLPQAGGREIRVAYGNMGPTPVRARAVERALEGQKLDALGIARALAVATEGLSPPTDSLASTWYRREVAPVHLRRLLLGEA